MDTSTTREPRYFANYAALQTALAFPTDSPHAFRLLPEYGPATFFCASCWATKSLSLGTGGTGYAVRRDARNDEQFCCYACAARIEREEMIKTGRATLYLTYAGRHEHAGTLSNVRVVNWTGELSFPATAWSESRRGGGFGSQRTDAWFIGPDGYAWHAINRGDMQIARCRRLKVRTRFTLEQVREMSRAYLECALWADCRDDSGESIQHDATADDFTKKDQRAAFARCRDFVRAAGALLVGWTPEQAGHDLWLTHNRHGAGFWDRGRDAGEALSELARPYGDASVRLSTRGKPHLEI